LIVTNRNQRTEKGSTSVVSKITFAGNVPLEEKEV